MALLLSSAGTASAAENGLVLLTSEDNGFCAMARVGEDGIAQADYDDAVRASVATWLRAPPLPPRQGEAVEPSKKEVDFCGRTLVLRDPREPGHDYYGVGFIGVTATAPLLWSFEELPREQKALAMANYIALATVLRQHYGFPPVVPLLIDRVLVGNLDDDPALERLIEANWNAMTGPNEFRPTSTGYRLLILADDEQPPRPLVGNAWLRGSMEFDVFDLPMEVLMVADLDRDGLPEIAYSHGYGGGLLTGTASGFWREAAQCSFTEC